MKNIFYILFLLCTISCTNFNSYEEVNISLLESKPIVTVLGNENIEFGIITEGETVDLEFRIKNTGDGSLIITHACVIIKLPSPVFFILNSKSTVSPSVIIPNSIFSFPKTVTIGLLSSKEIFTSS